jgi:hypothetical protein
MLVPGQPVRKLERGVLAALRPGDDPLEPPGRTADELSFVLDGRPGALAAEAAPGLRVVRYAVVGLRLPDGDGLSPCLVRFETACPAGLAVPDWAALLARSPAAGGWQVVAEQVTGFRVDCTLDGQFPGIRGADYPATFARLEAAVRGREGGAGAARPLDPFWFRRHPVLVSILLETRSPVARDGYAPAGAARSRCCLGRRQRLLVSPRNFGLEPGP